MPAVAGKRYVSRSGAEVIVTKGGAGVLQDGETPLQLKEEGPPASGGSGGEIQLGKRYASADGDVEVLCIRAGACDLRSNGEPMSLMQPKVLPSADWRRPPTARIPARQACARFAGACARSRTACTAA